MRQSHRSWRMVVLAGLAAACAGCGGSEGSGGPGGPGAKGNVPAGSVESPDGQVPTEKPAEVKPPPPPTIPKVVFDNALKATCKVWVGDKMPDGQLPDLDGNLHPINDLFGKKLTVVVFWSKGNLYALQELEDLGNDVVKPYSEKGVAVIAVDVGDPPEQVRQALKMTGATLPVLLDSSGSYFAKVATEKIPRTYVLGPDGKILWFDADYSEATCRNMLQTIRVALGETGKR
jgi:peroxiredoxin